jgi:hypothetical protein
MVRPEPAGRRGASPATARGFALNYAATGLVIDLLDRIAGLEATMRRQRLGGK